MSHRSRVLVVDDHALLAEGLALALDQRGLEVRTVTDPAPEGIVDAAAEFGPDVVLLDVFLGDDGSNARSVIGDLRAGGAEVLVLTGAHDPLELAGCVEAGATGLLSKTDGLEEVLVAVVRAASHEHEMPRGT